MLSAKDIRFIDSIKIWFFLNVQLNHCEFHESSFQSLIWIHQADPQMNTISHKKRKSVALPQQKIFAVFLLQ